MKKTLKRIAPLRLGIVLAALYSFIAVIFIPIMLVPILITSNPDFATAGNNASQVSIIAAIGGLIFMGLLYPVMGFLTGVIGAALYNLVAGWTGGIEVEVE